VCVRDCESISAVSQDPGPRPQQDSQAMKVCRRRPIGGIPAAFRPRHKPVRNRYCSAPPIRPTRHPAVNDRDYNGTAQIQSHALSAADSQHARSSACGTRSIRLLYADNSTVRRTFASPLAQLHCLIREYSGINIRKLPWGDPRLIGDHNYRQPFAPLAAGLLAQQTENILNRLIWSK